MYHDLALNQITEKCKRRKRDLHLLFMDVEKVYERVNRDDSLEKLEEYTVENKWYIG